MNAVASGADDGVARRLVQFRDAWRKEIASRQHYQSPVLKPIVGAMRNVVIADTDAEAEKIARGAYERWYAKLNWLWLQRGQAAPTGFSGDYDTARNTGSLIVGSPKSVQQELSAQAHRCGYNYLLMVMNFGSMTHGEALRSLELFRREVMPNLERLDRDGEPTHQTADFVAARKTA